MAIGNFCITNSTYLIAYYAIQFYIVIRGIHNIKQKKNQTENACFYMQLRRKNRIG